ncbi:hypothetical protein ABZP36_000900 [Zizania latifolia]
MVFGSGISKVVLAQWSNQGIRRILQARGGRIRCGNLLLNNAAVAESSQRKQPLGHEAQQSSPIPNMLQGPAFIFPFNQQHAAATAVAAANAANRVDDTKPSGGSNAMPRSATAHTSAADPGAAAMNLSFTNLQPADAQFSAILQNGGYTFPVAAHAGGPPSYEGWQHLVILLGDILFLHMSKDPIRTGEIVIFNVDGREIPIVHRVIKVHQR